MRSASKLLWTLILVCGAALAQQPINPITQIRWPLLTGAGTPAATGAICDAAHYSMIYQNTAVTPNTLYTCGTDGYAIRTNLQVVNFRGTWDPATTYSKNDAVFYNGSTYVSLQDNNLNQNPATQTAYWSPLVSGASADTVVQHPTGSQGIVQTAGTNFSTNSLVLVGTNPAFCLSGNSSTTCANPTNGSLTATSAGTMDFTSFTSQIPKTNCMFGYLMAGYSSLPASVPSFCGTSTAATFVGTPGINLKGIVLNAASTGQAVAAPASANGAKTFYFAGFYPPFGTMEGINWGDEASLATNPAIMCGSNINLGCFLNNASPDAIVKLGVNFSSYPNGGLRTMELSRTGWHVLALVCNNAGSGDQVYQDGQQMQTINGTGSNICPTSLGAGNWQLGGSTVATNAWKSMIASGWFAYSVSHTATQVQSISNALLGYMSAFGAVNQQPLINTTNYNPQLTTWADSRTAGSAATPWTNYTVFDDPNWVTNNIASSGSGALEWCTASDTVGTVYALKTSKSSVAIVWLGINDITRSPTLSAALYQQIEAGYKCIAAKLKPLGYTLFIATEVAGGGNIYDAGKNNLDPVIRRYAKGWGYDSIVELATVTCIGADGASASTACYSAVNSLHQNNFAEQNILAPIWSNTINEYFGSSVLSWNSTNGTTYTEVAADGFLQLNGGGVQTITLPDCQGYSRPRTIWNSTAFTDVVNPNVSGFLSTFTQTINGGSSFSLPANSTATFQPVPGPTATAGCSWVTI